MAEVLYLLHYVLGTLKQMPLPWPPSAPKVKSSSSTRTTNLVVVAAGAACQHGRGPSGSTYGMWCSSWSRSETWGTAPSSSAPTAASISSSTPPTRDDQWAKHISTGGRRRHCCLSDRCKEMIKSELWLCVSFTHTDIHSRQRNISTVFTNRDTQKKLSEREGRRPSWRVSFWV
jgi:hypothetical protein